MSKVDQKLESPVGPEELAQAAALRAALGDDGGLSEPAREAAEQVAAQRGSVEEASVDPELLAVAAVLRSQGSSARLAPGRERAVREALLGSLRAGGARPDALAAPRNDEAGVPSRVGGSRGGGGALPTRREAMVRRSWTRVAAPLLALAAGAFGLWWQARDAESPERTAVRGDDFAAPRASSPAPSPTSSPVGRSAPDEDADWSRIMEAGRRARTASIRAAGSAALSAAHDQALAAVSETELLAAEQALENVGRSLLAHPGSSGGALAKEELGSRRLEQALTGALAELALRLGAAADAERWAQEGLAVQLPPDLVSAHLLVLRGQAQRAQGDFRGAAASLMEAITVNESLLDRDLEGEVQ